MSVFFYIVVFLLGISLGSFVNMTIYRVAVKYGLEKENKKVGDKKRSYCDYCGRQLRWYENIPVVSWLIQGGKSRCCYKKLSVLYPIVELTGGLLLVLVFWRFNLFLDFFSWVFLVKSVFVFLVITLLIFVFFFDLKYMIIPDFSVVSLVLVALIGVVFDEPNIVPYLLSGIGAMAFLYLLYLITKKRGMGFGDVKFALFMGLFLGWPKIGVAMYLAFVLGAFFGFVGMLLRKVGRKSKIPFGPFLIVGLLLAWLWGNELIHLVLKI